MTHLLSALWSTCSTSKAAFFRSAETTRDGPTRPLIKLRSRIKWQECLSQLPLIRNNEMAHSTSFVSYISGCLHRFWITGQKSEISMDNLTLDIVSPARHFVETSCAPISMVNAFIGVPLNLTLIIMIFVTRQTNGFREAQVSAKERDNLNKIACTLYSWIPLYRTQE